MHPLTPWLWGAGAGQLVLLGASLALPHKLQFEENLAHSSRIVEQLFRVLWTYILFLLAAFAGLCFFLAEELLAGGALSRALCVFLALFWSGRLGIQLFYYDRALKREHRAASWFFAGVIAYLAEVFLLAVWSVG